MAAPLSFEDFCRETGVSRETSGRLERYGAALVKWQKAINLVAPESLADLWRRHFLDSAQLIPLIPPGSESLTDLGSGAGFPGLVLALAGAARQIELVESDQRKSAFLREALRLAEAPPGVEVAIRVERAEKLAPRPADIVTARALAPLSALLELASPRIGPSTICLFLKGKQAAAELTEAAKGWTMKTELHPSRSDPSGAILRLTDVRRR